MVKVEGKEYLQIWDYDTEGKHRYLISLGSAETIYNKLKDNEGKE